MWSVYYGCSVMVCVSKRLCYSFNNDIDQMKYVTRLLICRTLRNWYKWFTVYLETTYPVRFLLALLDESGHSIAGGFTISLLFFMLLLQLTCCLLKSMIKHPNLRDTHFVWGTIHILEMVFDIVDHNPMRSKAWRIIEMKILVSWER